MFNYINKKLFSVLCIIAVVLGAVALLWGPDSPAEDALSITFVDVGQGDSVLIQSSISGKTLLIDGGEKDSYTDKLLPILRSRGINALDYALVTHYHSDHTGGISKLLEDRMIKTLMLPDYKHKSRDSLYAKAQKSNADVLWVCEGTAFPEIDPSLSIRVLHPQKGGFSEDENDNSVVLFLEYNGSSFLLTGDLEAEGEKVIVDDYDIEADVLKVGHHGSFTSTSQNFLEAVNPTYAIIQVGKDNSYGHPHNETLEALENDDVLVYRTDTDGSITFSLSEHGISKISTERGSE